MKGMLAAILSVALVSPAFASVDLLLTGMEGTSLIMLPATELEGWITLRLEMTKPDPPVGITGFNAALEVHSIWGSGQFKIKNRAVGTDANGATLADASYMSDGVVGSVLSPRSPDIGLYKSSGFWDANQFPATVGIFTVEYSGLQGGDVYEFTIGDPGGGIVVADDSFFAQRIPVGRITTVRVQTPEPASLLLLAVGGLFLLRRRT